MEFGISTHSLIPVRSEPSHKSEMVTQVLFGELYRVTEKTNLWVKIQLVYDNYEGWIHIRQACFIDEPEFIRLTGVETTLTLDLVQLITNETKSTMWPILLGSSLPGLSAQRLRINGDEYLYEGSVAESSGPAGAEGQQNAVKTRQNIVGNAMLYLHAPYLWGGRSPFGIDCSGFIQMIFKLENIKLLRDALQQAGQGEVISLLAEAEPGDIVFFDDEEGNINHVGLLSDNRRVIHCSGKVRIDTLDHEGIYNDELQKYTHKLRLIKRVI
jgi:gamma-D-glutamyl-L-lysine dipeptidyl-peptidase